MKLHDVDHLAHRTLRPLTFALALLVAAPGFANDWPQWRGEDRRGEWTETGIVEALPGELKVAWRVPINSGYSGARRGRRARLHHRLERGPRVADGGRHRAGPRPRRGDRGGALGAGVAHHLPHADVLVRHRPGRATPTVDGDRVYVVGAAGDLYCLDVETGDVLWEKHYIADYDSFIPTWGVTSAPIVDGDRLITVVGGEPGGLVMAWDKRDRRGDLAGPRRRRRDGLRPAHHHRGRAGRGSSSSGTRRPWCR